MGKLITITGANRVGKGTREVENMTTVNFPSPPEGSTHKITHKITGVLVYFYNEREGTLYDAHSGRWMFFTRTLDSLYKYPHINIEPLTVELENK